MRPSNNASSISLTKRPLSPILASGTFLNPVAGGPDVHDVNAQVGPGSVQRIDRNLCLLYGESATTGADT